MGNPQIPGCSGGHDAAPLKETDVPGMPNIGPSEQVAAVPYPLVDGISPTIGWQFRPRGKGGPAFMIIRRSSLGSLKAVESFPLTEDGWASMWQSFITRNPGAASRVLAALRARESDTARLKDLEGVTARPSPAGVREASEPLPPRLVTLRDLVLLGGYVPEVDLFTGRRYHVLFFEDRLWLVLGLTAVAQVAVPYSEIEDIEIGGPGLVKKGGGFVGGGLGAAGAIEGMAIASVLNGLTSRTSIKTILRIQGTSYELFLLHGRMTPEQLRIELSRPLAAIRSIRAATAAEGTQDKALTRSAPVEELTKLADMLEKGLLTRDEFDLMKAKLLGLQT
jgi:hypothetical protein